MIDYQGIYPSDISLFGITNFNMFLKICFLFLEGVSHMEHNTTPTSGSIPTTSKSQKRQLESPAFQSKISGSLDKIRDRPLAKTASHLPQDKMGISDREEKSCSSKSEQMDNRPSSSKTSLSR